MKRLLIVGAGDIARRVHSLVFSRYRVAVLARRESQAADWRRRGVLVFTGDLDNRRSLHRIAGWADLLIDLAPPAGQGPLAPRTRHLLAALEGAPTLPQRAVYISTTGVYGDHGGARIGESAPQYAASERALRRQDAERQWRAFSRRRGVALTILRVPGIYAADRLPLQRLKSASPTLMQSDDVFSNHVHADDLARAIVAALWRGSSCRSYNACDDDEMRMADYFDAVADATGLARPARVSRAEAGRRLTPGMLSYLGDSRRVSNARIKRELRLTLRYPTLADGLAAVTGAHTC